MKKTFREYHQFTEDEFKKLFQDCLFVFDTNALLNMYRYSRKTVETYIEVLNELKNKKQLWIPYQVGYEFYENRITVISQHEKSYDEILSILEKAKNDISQKYKDHPFLDLPKIQEEINKGLSGAENIIKDTKDKHPKWLEKDDVLENINKIFEGNVGRSFDNDRLEEIKREGKERYERRVPPGYSDEKKSEDKKYGDLILWLQIIEKAKENKKPIILISGDVKEDWWFKEDGKRIMPLPQLKKEMYEKADVDFHIYTFDRFLELTETDKKQAYEEAIKEIRKVRKLEEKRKAAIEEEVKVFENERGTDSESYNRYRVNEYSHMLSMLNSLLAYVRKLDISSKHREEVEYLFHKADSLGNRDSHRISSRVSLSVLYDFVQEVIFVLEDITHSENIDTESYLTIEAWIDRIKNKGNRLNRYSQNK